MIADMTHYETALERLRSIIKEAGTRHVHEPAAATLATADAEGRPSARTIFVASIESAGLVFFANQKSGKGQQLTTNPYAALCYFWRDLRKQVTLEGEVEILSAAESDHYWKLRYREAKLGAWASEQASPFRGKEQLQAELSRQRKQFSSEFVPRPENWRAFRLQPARIEFWKTGWQRLNPRIKYLRGPNGVWTIEQENP